MPTKQPKQIGIMKAKPATEKLLLKLSSRCIAQPKLRGQRARTTWIGDTPILLSSYGNPFYFMEHITSELSQLPHLPYDGELYVHSPEWGQERINSACGCTVNRSPETIQIQYHIFDLAMVGPQLERLDVLWNALPYPGTNVHPLQFNIIPTSDWAIWCSSYLKEGYEGIVLRDTNGLYSPLDLNHPAQRPSTILKFKPSEFDDYTIIDLIPGSGWCTGMLGAFLVQSPEGGAPFSVGTGPELTKPLRQKYWSLGPTLIGKTLRVKHEPISTSGGIPICTVAYKVI